MIERLGHYSLTNPASIYDEDAMTALQLAARTAAKVNECVTEVNNIPGTVENAVETHIQNGEFDKQISDYAGELETRLNNLLGSVTTGSTTLDAEVLDIRVGENGDTYGSAGEALRGEIARCLRSGNVHLSTANYTNYFTDANEFTDEKIYFIDYGITSEHIKNLPYYSRYALLFNVKYSTNNRAGLVQMYVSGNDFTYRFVTGTDAVRSFGEWCGTKRSAASQFAIGKSNTVTIIISSNSIQVNGSGYIWGGNAFTSVTNLKESTLNFTSTSAHTSVVYIRDNTIMQHSLSTYSPLISDIVLAVLYLSASATVTQIVWAFGREEMKDVSTNERTCSIFQKVVCCGDSYTSGHIAISEGTTIENEKFAWPAFMAKLTGNTYINCGSSGANVLTWQTRNAGLIKAQAAGKAQAYLLGLGINDSSGTSDRGVDLGTTADIGTTTESFYGGLSAIIRELAAISPNAAIFVQTMPRSGNEYNTAIRDVVSAYASSYNVHLLDLEEYMELYTNNSLTGDLINGHYTAIGYQQFAEILCRVWSDYINNHIADFQNVHLIEYDE